MCAAALLNASGVGVGVVAVAGAEAGHGASALSHASESVLAGEQPDTEGVACVGCGGGGGVDGGGRVTGEGEASPDSLHGVGGVCMLMRGSHDPSVSDIAGTFGDVVGAYSET